MIDLLDNNLVSTKCQLVCSVCSDRLSRWFVHFCAQCLLCIGTAPNCLRMRICMRVPVLTHARACNEQTIMYVACPTRASAATLCVHAHAQRQHRFAVHLSATTITHQRV